MLDLAQILHLGASEKFPITACEAQWDLWPGKTVYLGTELFGLPALPHSPAHRPATNGRFTPKTPELARNVPCSRVGDKRDLEAVRFPAGPYLD